MQRKWKRRCQRLAKILLPPIAAGMLLVSAYSPVFANPAGGNVTSGSAVITANGSTMTVNQATNKAIINWQNFSIGKGETVTFVQPMAASVALNRVVGNNASSIYGSLNANGKVFLINPNGILFAPGSQVNVGGLVASTLNLSDNDFLNGNTVFAKNGSAQAVINQGNITAADHVALLGPQVKNEGVIAARVTGLAAGNKVSLDFNGDKLLNVTVDTGAAGGSASNSGTISASDGLVVMSVGTKDKLLNTVVNNSGVIMAQSVNNVNGIIRLEGGSVTNSGTLDASGKAYGQTGGTVKVLGDTVTLANVSSIDVSGDTGGGTALIGGAYQGGGSEYTATNTTVQNGATITADAITSGNGGQVVVWANNTTNFAGTITAKGGSVSGDGGSVETSGKKTLKVADTARVITIADKGQTGNWLLDPADFTIAAAGGDMTGSTLSTALQTSDVTIATNAAGATVNGAAAGTGHGTNGDINVNDSVNWSSHKLTLSAYNNININTKMNGSGTAQLSLKYGQKGVAAGNISTYNVNASVNLPAGNNFSTQLGTDGSVINYTVITSLGNQGSTTKTDLQGIVSMGYYALGADIDASATSTWNYNSATNSYQGFNPLGLCEGFDGLGHTISNLTINRPNSDYVGLYQFSMGTIRNVGLTGATITGRNYVGALLAQNGTTGSNKPGTVMNSYTTGTVSGNNYVGGLVGQNGGDGRSSNKGGDGTITNCYSIGNVSGIKYVGGLVGQNGGNSGSEFDSYGKKGGDATILSCYSSSTINGTTYVGGLVGQNGGISVNYAYRGATFDSIGGVGKIENSYSTGTVSGTYDVGGLVGTNGGDSVNIYAGLSAGAGTITNCYSLSAVNGSDYVGGLVGQNGGNAGTSNEVNSHSNGGAGTIINSFSRGTVTSTGTNVGSLVGKNGCNDRLNTPVDCFGGTGTIQNSFSTSSGPSQLVGATVAGKSTIDTQSTLDTNKDIIAGKFSGSESNVTIEAYVNGSAAGTTPLGASGIYYFPVNKLTSTDKIAFVVRNGGGVLGNSVYYVGDTGYSLLTNALANLNLTSSTLTIGGINPNSPITNTILGAAYVPGNSIYNVSGSNLTVNTGFNLQTPSGFSYQLDGNVTTPGGTQTYNGLVTLAPGNYTMTGSKMIFNDRLSGGGSGLTIDGVGVFNGKLPNSVVLVDLTVNKSALINGDIGTGGNQIYKDTVELLSDAKLSSTMGLTFNKSVNGAAALTIESTGNVRFNAGVGESTKLKSLYVKTMNGSPVPVKTYLNGNISTTGTQTYDGPVVLNGDSTLTGSAVTFQNTVDSAAATNKSLKIEGIGTFNSSVGVNSALSSLEVAKAADVSGNITTTGEQTYDDAVVLNGDVTLTGSTVNFKNSINSAAGVSKSLTIAGNGVLDVVGNSSALSSLEVTQAAALNGDITTVGAQTYGCTVSMNAARTLSVTGSGDILFNGAVNAGANTLTLSTGGSIKQGVDGAIIAGVLRFSANGTVDLANAVNSVDSLTGSAGTLSFQNGKALTIGASGLTASGNAGITANSLNLSGAVNIGSNALGLTTTSGGISQGTTGIITAGSLNLSSNGTVNLANAVNSVDKLTGTTGTLNFKNGKALIIGGSGLNVGGNSIVLTTTTGGITQTGSITAGLLSLSTSSTVNLANSGNMVGTITGSTGEFEFRNGRDLTIGASGLTASGNAGITANSLNLSGAVNAGGNALSLTTTSGGISQGTTGIITVGSLNLSASGTVTLANAGNRVDTITGTTGELEFQNGQGLTIGADGLSAAGNILLTAMGVTFNGNVSADQIKAVAKGTNPGSDVTLNSGVQLTASGSGNAMVLAADNGRFINNAGASVINVTGGGRWLIYSADPDSDTFGGLASGNKAVWDKTYAGYSPDSVSQSGNRYLFKIQPTITFSVPNVTKTYGDVLDLSSAYTINGIRTNTYGGAMLADTASDAYTGTPSFSSAAVAASANVTGSPYSIQSSGVTAINGYAVATTCGTVTVIPATLTGVTATSQSRAYGDANPVFNGTATGWKNGDGNLLLTGFTTTAIQSTSVGSYVIDASGVSAGGNYIISGTPTNSTLTITPRPITVTANNASKAYGDTNPASGTVTLTAGSLVGSDTLSNANLSSTATTTSSVGNYTLTPSGVSFTNGSASNYNISYANGTLTITPRPITITANNASKAYGDTNPANGTVTLTAGSLAGSDALGTASLSSTATTTSSVGDYTLTSSGVNFTSGSASNYNVSYANGTLTITPRPITVTANNASKVYGDTNPMNGTVTLTAGSLAGSDTLSSASLSSTATTTSSVGDYTLTPSGVNFTSGSASNYNIGYSNGTLTVTPKAITITAANASKTYGEANPTTASVTVVPDSLVGSDTLSNANLSSTASATSNVGDYTLTPSGVTFSSGSAANYNITYTNGTLTVTPKAIIITAANASKTYGEANPTTGAVTVAPDSLVGSDALGNANLSSTASATSNVGDYTLTPSGVSFTSGSASNYSISYANSTLTISKAALTVTANNTTKYSGQANPTFTASYSGLGASDTPASLNGALTFATAATTASNPGTYAITLTGTLSSPNYTISYVNGVLTVSGRAANPAYDGAVIHAEQTAFHLPGSGGRPGPLTAYWNPLSGYMASAADTYVPLTIRGSGINTGGYMPWTGLGNFGKTDN